MVGNLKSNHMNQPHNAVKGLYQQTLSLTISGAKVRLEKLVINYNPLTI